MAVISAAVIFDAVLVFIIPGTLENPRDIIERDEKGFKSAHINKRLSGINRRRKRTTRVASRERERIYIYVTKKNVFEEKRIYLHGCFDSFGMLRFASRVIKESSKSSCIHLCHTSRRL